MSVIQGLQEGLDQVRAELAQLSTRLDAVEGVVHDVGDRVGKLQATAEPPASPARSTPAKPTTSSTSTAKSGDKAS